MIAPTGCFATCPSSVGKPTPVSLWLGHAQALTTVQVVIHYRFPFESAIIYNELSTSIRYLVEMMGFDSRANYALGLPRL